MIIYMSGPITNVLDYEQKFADAEAAIKKRYPDYEVINPTMIKLPSTCTHKQYMAIDFMLLDLADAVCMLPGWELSRGCNQEYGYAMANNLIVLELEQLVR